MKPVIGAVLAVLATCGDQVVFNVDDGGTDGGGVDGGGVDGGTVDAGVPCEGGCFSANACVPPGSATVTTCGSNAGVCIDCSTSVLHASLPSCSAGACDFFACETGWSSCDNDRSNGCERNVSICYEVLTSHQTGGLQIETDGVYVYWNMVDGMRKMPVAGGAPFELFNGTVHAFVLHDQSLFLATTGGISVMPKAGGTPVVLAPLGQVSYELVTDGTTVFWVDGEKLKSVPVAGGQVTTLLSDPPSDVINLTLVDDAVFFTVNSEVMKMPKSGGAVTRVATLPADRIDPRASLSAVLTRDVVYWATVTKREDQRVAPLEAKLYSMQYSTSIVTDIMTFDRSSPTLLKIDGANLFVLSTCDRHTSYGVLVRIPLTGGAPAVLASQLEPIGGAAIDATSIYWLDGDYMPRVFKSAKAP